MDSNSWNIHPLVVHFPIALISVYAVAELVRFKKLLAQSAWFYIKAFLITIGGLSTLVALYFGDIAKSALGGHGNELINLHETFAKLSTAFAGLIALAYLISVIDRSGYIKLPGFVLKYAAFIQKTWVIVILALALLASIVITGALGGSIVYGPDSDFAVKTIYHLFFK